MFTRFRKSVDTYIPFAGRVYRAVREVGSASRFRKTRYGFGLAGEAALAKEGYEENEVVVFLDCIENHDTVLDIGANIGFYTCLASGKGKHVLAFEPSERNLRFLFRNLWDNGFRDVEVFPVGLGSKAGLHPIYGFAGVASFVPGWAQTRKSRFAIVPVLTLDAAVGTRFQQERLLIKVDVEGFELEILKGASAILAQTPRPTWMMEIFLRNQVIPGGVNPRFLDTFEAFWNSGYQCCKLDQNRSPVSREDVVRWQTQGVVEDDTVNFLFS